MNRRLDEDLERLLADRGGELGELYRRLPRAEPPRRLDRSVLAEAALAVRGRPPRRQRWLVGFGSAAGFVLAAGVAWHIGHEALRAPPPAADRGTPSYVPVQPLDAPLRQHADAPAVDAAPAETAPAPETAAPAPAPAKPVAAPPARTRPAAAAPKPRTTDGPPPPAPQAAAAPAEAATANEAGQRESAAVAAEPFPAAPAPAARSDAAKAEGAGRKAPARRAAGAPSPSSSMELRRDTQLAPEVWIARIEQLLREGRRQQAIESLRLFRRAHPDWALPQDLRALDP